MQLLRFRIEEFGTGSSTVKKEKKPRRDYSSLPWIRRPPQRTFAALFVIFLLFYIMHFFWQPGRAFKDGSHDLKRNALWLQHGWIGADSWFVENNRLAKKPLFRDVKKVREFADLLNKHHIADVYPHLCPVQNDGAIMPVDDRQTELFLRELEGVRVLPWIGAPREDLDPQNAARRKVFVQSAAALLKRHPQFLGVHLNVEPWPDGNPEMLLLLDELRAALPTGKILSIAAYPPPTWWQPVPEVHWSQSYFEKVAARCDQMAVMMYDTGIRSRKIYQAVMRDWTRDVLNWTKGLKMPPQILLGVPVYDDDELYHRPGVENLETALLGIHAGLSDYPKLPAHYQGAAIYSDWTMDGPEWQYWRNHFCKP